MSDHLNSPSATEVLTDLIGAVAALRAAFDQLFGEVAPLIGSEGVSRVVQAHADVIDRYKP